MKKVVNYEESNYRIIKLLEENIYAPMKGTEQKKME